MPHIEIRSSAVAAVASLVVSLACLGLAACGSSSGGSPGSQTGSAATTAPPGTTASRTPPPSTSTPATTAPTESATAIAQRRKLALRVASCMRSKGIKVPEPSATGYIKVGAALAGSSSFRASTAQCIAEAGGSASTKK
jgi:hypothetical protein